MHRPRTLTVAAALAAVLLVLAAPAMASGGGQGGRSTRSRTRRPAMRSPSSTGRATARSRRRDGRRRAETGTGAGLGSQGALVLDDDRLFAVNAGSNTISLLHVDRRGKVTLADVEPVRRRRADQRHRPRQVRLRPERRATRPMPANIHGFRRALGQPRAAGRVDPAAEHGGARPGTDRVQPERQARWS